MQFSLTSATNSTADLMSAFSRFIRIPLLSALFLLFSSVGSFAQCQQSEFEMRQAALSSNDPRVSEQYFGCYRYSDNAISVRPHLRKLTINQEYRTIVDSKNEDAMLEFIIRNPEKSRDAMTRIQEWRRERQFVIYTHSVLGGIPAGQIRTDTAAQCQKSCGADCAGFTFNSADRVCWLWEEVSGRLPRGGHTSGAIDALPITVSGPTSQPTPPSNTKQSIELMYDVDLPNPRNSSKDYRILRRTSLQSCLSYCERDSKCRAFTHNGDANVCFLKTDFTQMLNYSNATSGIKR